MTTAATTTRWRPTPDQLAILEELYIRGLKTPNASQIQRITAHLSRYGKIECKNVFYWFQNHKAREKQKLRKRLLLGKQLHDQQQQQLFGTSYHQNTNSVLYFFEPNYSRGFLQFPQYCNSSVNFPSQETVPGGAQQLIPVDTSSSSLKLKKWVRLYSQLNQAEGEDHGHDDGWMTSTFIKEVGPTGYYSATSCTTIAKRPPETLQLFPTTSATTTTVTSSASSSSSSCLKDQPTLSLN